MDSKKIQTTIRSIISEAFDTRSITKIIKQTSEEFMEDNECSLWDINNGLCDYFSTTVMEKMGGYQDNLFELSGDMFFNVADVEFAKENWVNIIETRYGVWSKEMLERYGYPKVDLKIVDDTIDHVWIYFNGRHYDAEAPNGVAYWYELPLCKKFFKSFKKG